MMLSEIHWRKKAYIWFQLHKILVNANLCVVIENRLLGDVRSSNAGRYHRGHTVTLKVVYMLIILIVMMAAYVYVCVKAY